MTAHETRRIRGQHPLVGQDKVGIYFPVGRRRFCGASGPKLVLTQAVQVPEWCRVISSEGFLLIGRVSQTV